MPSASRRPTVRPAAWIASLLATLIALALLPAASLATPTTKAVSFDGYRLSVPAGWPVFRLATAPATCVRFNRHAVYLGQPSAQQNCSGRAAGRTEAILVQPLRARAAQVLPATTAAATIASTRGRNERASIASDGTLIGGNVSSSAPAGPTPMPSVSIA